MVTTGTLMERSHVPLHKWLAALFMEAASREGSTPTDLQRELEVTYKTAWILCQRLRDIRRRTRLRIRLPRSRPPVPAACRWTQRVVSPFAARSARSGGEAPIGSMKAVRLRQGASVVCFPRRGFFFTVLSTVIRASGVLSAVATSRAKRSATSSLLKASERGFFMRSLFLPVDAKR